MTTDWFNVLSTVKQKLVLSYYINYNFINGHRWGQCVATCIAGIDKLFIKISKMATDWVNVLSRV